MGQLGGIDILVNNAAYQMAHPGGLEGITTEQLYRVMKTNLCAMSWLSRSALPQLGKGATIIKGLAQAVAERGIRIRPSRPAPSGRRSSPP